MKTIIKFVSVTLIFIGLNYQFSNALTMDLPLTGKWEGLFMDQYNLELRFTQSSDLTYTGRILLFDGKNLIQDDEIMNIIVTGYQISFTIPAKETLFEGNINEQNSGINGMLIFPDGNRYPIQVNVSDNVSLNQDEKENVDIIGKTYSSDQLEEDFNILVREIKNNHPNLYQYIKHDEFDAIVNSIQHKIDRPMSQLEYFKLISMVIAKIRCSHTGIRMQREYQNALQEENKYFPLKLYFSNDKAWVLSGIKKNPEIHPGAELISINNVPLKNIMAVLFSFIPVEGFNQTTKYYMINNHFETLYRMIYAAEDFDIEFKEPSGNKVLHANVSADSYSNIGNSEVNDKYGGESFRLTFLKDFNTAVLEIPSFTYINIDQYLKDIDQSFTKLLNENTSSLILDIRGNSGGHPIFAAILFSYLTQKPFTYFKNSETKVEEFEPLYNTMEANKKAFPGNVYIWIDGGCLSTTGHFISLMKYYNRAVFLGEEPGSWFSCNDNSVKRKLPNTGIELNIPRTTFETAVSGFESGDIFKVDYPVIISVDDKLDNKDIYLNKTLEIISNPSKTL